jgi:hypothetical protein
MRRREFMKMITAAASAWPLAVRAQQQAAPVIGYLSARLAEFWSKLVRRLGISDCLARQSSWRIIFKMCSQQRAV